MRRGGVSNFQNDKNSTILFLVLSSFPSRTTTTTTRAMGTEMEATTDSDSEQSPLTSILEFFGNNSINKSWNISGSDTDSIDEQEVIDKNFSFSSTNHPPMMEKTTEDLELEKLRNVHVLLFSIAIGFAIILFTIATCCFLACFCLPSSCCFWSAKKPFQPGKIYTPEQEGPEPEPPTTAPASATLSNNIEIGQIFFNVGNNNSATAAAPTPTQMPGFCSPHPFNISSANLNDDEKI